VGKDQPTNQQPEVSPLTESEAVRRLEDITRLVSDWVWEVDRDYKIIFISDRVLDVLGYHPRELHGKPLKEIIDFDVPSAKELTDIVRRPFRDKPGKVFQISPERVRQIEHSVFLKIQKIVRTESLRVEAMAS